MSRELDARVAEAMGYDTDKCAGCGKHPYDHAWRNEGSGACVSFRLPSFSTDPAACEEVKKEIRRRTFDHDISWSSGGYRVTLKGGVSNHVGSHCCEYTAICLAFLEAVEAVEAEKGAGNGK